MPPLNRLLLRTAAHRAENADFWTTNGDHEVARDLASSAALTLLEALGLDERQVETVRMMIVDADARAADYAAAHDDGRIVCEEARS